MTFPFTDNIHSPLTSNTDIEERVSHLIGSANLRQLWVLFLDPSDVQLPLLIPICGLPHAPEWSDTSQVIRSVDEVMQEIGAERLVLVWERCASPRLSAVDLLWVRQIASVCDKQHVPLRAVLLSHHAGIRWIAPDDFAF
jgi:hypothetical protein